MQSVGQTIQVVVAFLLFCPSISFCAEQKMGFEQSQISYIGSGMTDEEEALALVEDPITKELICQASESYATALSQYSEGSISWVSLQAAYNAIFAKLLFDLAAQIQSSQGTIHAIASDYDSEHSVAFKQHLQSILGIAQSSLGLLASQVFMPPLPQSDETYPNLVQGGQSPSSSDWALTAGIGTLVNGQITTTSPNGASFTQTIATIPGHWYLISGTIIGSSQGKDKYGNSNPYSGNICVVHANPQFPQVSNELDEEGMHRRYFSVQALDTSMTISLSGAGAIGENQGPLFGNISVRDLNIDCSTLSGQIEAMNLAQSICPPVLTTGSQEVGWYPQVESLLEEDSNLIDGGVSIMKNVDLSALGNAGHPYWYFGKKQENPVDQNIKIINGLNGAHGLFLPAGADPVANGPVPIPRGDYVVSCDVDVFEGSGASMRISFSGTDLQDGSQIAKIYQDYINLSAGCNTITFSVSASTFSASGVLFRPAITFENIGTIPVSIYNMSLLASSTEVYTQINNVNPYNPSRSWYASEGCNITYDFTQGDISTDWGIALTGNAMFSPSAQDVAVIDQGILLTSHSISPTLFDNGGIQSTQLIDPMRDFSIAVTFTGVSNDPGYEPTFAVWTYGESQRGPDAPLTHRNAPSSDIITEFDCEMGSDPNNGQEPATPNQMYMRPGSYIGYAAGGHNEILPANSNWILMPNFWQKNASGTYDHYLLIMSGAWSNGHLLLTRSIKDLDTQETTSLGTQDLGAGPFSPMYVKVALENPDWNSKSHSIGKACLVVEKITIIQGADIPENIPRKIPISEVDYTWFTPGGGGGMSYTLFPSR